MLNIIVPIAGHGSRFAKVGYKNPKPFIEIHNKFMVMHVVENINISGARYIFLCQKSHLQDFGASFIEAIKSCSPIKDFQIIPIDGITEGAACTVLRAKEFIDNNDELLIVNGDQLLPVDDIAKSVRFFEKKNADAGVLCFFATGIKWSYAAVDSSRQITRIAEKNPISEHATCGIYYVKHGKYFVQAAEDMIAKNDRTNNEFYVAPAFNYMLVNGYKILPYFVNEMYGLGTPEDLEAYLQGF